ncbi:hypothetical protein MC885_017906 [Smutsia gigantea]|nr:hypothetical protein MC885_017906 [Smutsia gigantea]
MRRSTSKDPPPDWTEAPVARTARLAGSSGRRCEVQKRVGKKNPRLRERRGEPFGSAEEQTRLRSARPLRGTLRPGRPRGLLGVECGSRLRAWPGAR